MTVTYELFFLFWGFFPTLQNKMQVDEDQQKAQDDGEKEDGEKKADAEEMEVIQDECGASHFPHTLKKLFSLLSRVSGCCCHSLTGCCLLFIQTSAEDGKQEKKADQPPQAKKAKVKTKVLDLPIENNPQWQLAIEMLNLFVENEVRLTSVMKI